MYTSTEEVDGWRDLQVKVARIFDELGYQTEIECNVDLANGAKVEVDVFAVKGDNALAQKVIVECKHWESDIPRAIVQSLKMEVLEAGANFGFIIAKQGFQPGAYEGVNMTNVKLFTFEELQENISSQWMSTMFNPLREMRNHLIDYNRNFELGTPERAYFEKCQISKELKELAWEIEYHLRMSLAIWEDYVPKDIYAKIHMAYVPDGFKHISITDTRSFAKELRLLFNEAFEKIKKFENLFGQTFLELSQNDQERFLRS